MTINKKIGLLLAFTTMFIMIGLLVLLKATINFDEAVQRAVFSIRTENLTLAKGITYLANWQTVSIICAMFLIIKKARFEIGVPISLATAFSTSFYHIAKILYGRPRPDVESHLINQGGLSFPSGHAMTGLVFYGLILFFILKKEPKKGTQKALFFGLTGLIFSIGFSRVYLGVHYATDVLAGWCAGAGILTLAIIVIEKVYPQNRFQ